MIELPDVIARLCRTLGAAAGVEAVTIGGSRAAGTADAGSDWDVGVYYRGRLDLDPLARYGEVYAPGAWGRIMNGGAWLSLEGLKVDVLLRDLDVALHWSAEARRGVYEVDALLGYLAGIPTYTLMAECAVNQTVEGRLPPIGDYPEPLAATGARRWSFHAAFSLDHAKMRADRGDIIGTVGQAAKAAMETAHAIACHRHLWVLNEKHLLKAVSLPAIQPLFTSFPSSIPALVSWTESVQASLEETLPRP